MDERIYQIAEQIVEIHQKAYEVYLPLVGDVCGQEVSEDELSHLLGYLLDFAYDEKMLELYKKLCRKYLYVYPRCIRFYIEAYREMWEDEREWLFGRIYLREVIVTMLEKVYNIIKGGEMEKIIKDTIHANGIDIGIYTQDFENEFISLTDIARYKSDDPTAVIQNWMRNRDVIEFLGLWERLHNPDFKPLEFEGFRKQAGANAFTMSPKKWIEATNAIGIVSKAGRYGGTYAHSDIAMSFATWISPEFQLYIMKDYRRLKTDENSRLSLNWNLNREISKLNYRIHTDAIKDNLIPPELTLAQIAYTYANEADMLNVVLFGKTAKQWKDENPTEKGNMRDVAALNQLLVLANLESYNAVLINQGKKQKERMELLRQLAVQQLQTLEAVSLSNLPQLAENDNFKK